MGYIEAVEPEFKPKAIHPKTQEIVRRHFLGYTMKEISESVGVSVHIAKQVLNSSFGKSLAQSMQARANSKVIDVRSRLQEMLPDALSVVENTLKSDDVRVAVRLKAAQDLLDRAGYGAVKQVDVRSTNLSVTPEQLEQIKMKAAKIVPQLGDDNGRV